MAVKLTKPGKRVSAQTIYNWVARGRVPPDRCPEIERVTGISCSDLRPDIFKTERRKRRVKKLSQRLQ